MQKILLFIFIPLFSWSQHPPADYFHFVSKADSLMRKKNFREAASAYHEAFDIFNGKGFVNDRYKAAGAYSRAGNRDSAFYNLFRIAEKGGWSEYEYLVSDSDLVLLHEDARWNKVVNLVRKNKAIAEARLNRPLAAELERIFDDDQKYRLLVDSAEKISGKDSPQLDSLRRLIEITDARNLKRAVEILDDYGWPGADEVGRKGSQALFLVILHSNPSMRKKYLPSIREASERNKVSPEERATLEDKVLLDEGNRQIYGTQLKFDSLNGRYEPYPIDDEEFVNERRSDIGLAPLEDYLRQWGIVYTPKTPKSDQK